MRFPFFNLVINYRIHRLCFYTLFDYSSECFRVYGIPKILRTDQGPEFRGKIFERFVQQHGIRHEFTAKGSPWQNGDLESFNGKFRDECLSRNLFEDLAETRQMIEKHRIFYNTERPHSGLNRKTPEEVYREGS